MNSSYLQSGSFILNFRDGEYSLYKIQSFDSHECHSQEFDPDVEDEKNSNPSISLPWSNYTLPVSPPQINVSSKNLYALYPLDDGGKFTSVYYPVRILPGKARKQKHKLVAFSDKETEIPLETYFEGVLNPVPTIVQPTEITEGDVEGAMIRIQITQKTLRDINIQENQANNNNVSHTVPVSVPVPLHDVTLSSKGGTLTFKRRKVAATATSENSQKISSTPSSVSIPAPVSSKASSYEIPLPTVTFKPNPHSLAIYFQPPPGPPPSVPSSAFVSHLGLVHRWDEMKSVADGRVVVAPYVVYDA